MAHMASLPASPDATAYPLAWADPTGHMSYLSRVVARVVFPPLESHCVTDVCASPCGTSDVPGVWAQDPGHLPRMTAGRAFFSPSEAHDKRHSLGGPESRGSAIRLCLAPCQIPYHGADPHGRRFGPCLGSSRYLPAFGVAVACLPWPGSRAPCLASLMT